MTEVQYSCCDVPAITSTTKPNPVQDRTHIPVGPTPSRPKQRPHRGGTVRCGLPYIERLCLSASRVPTAAVQLLRIYTAIGFHLLMYQYSVSKPFFTVTQCCCPLGPIYKSLSSDFMFLSLDDKSLSLSSSLKSLSTSLLTRCTSAAAGPKPWPCQRALMTHVFVTAAAPGGDSQ